MRRMIEGGLVFDDRKRNG